MGGPRRLAWDEPAPADLYDDGEGDLRLTARCTDCNEWISGTSVPEWMSEHLDIHSEHRVLVTRSGDLGALAGA